ncbi:hypothetical protein ACIOD2_30810 [Amycolatopsis sp. NPDC088138]|uniref:hypothetical protein n=1 Tax=Amycolatopsis sp. NPDC088138 TaxID=3363938 RepID=UPI0037F169A7
MTPQAGFLKTAREYSNLGVTGQGPQRRPVEALRQGKLEPGQDPAQLEVLQVSGALVKRAANVAGVLAIIWGGCFLMTLPFGLSDLGFSLIFATALTAAILLVVGAGILFKRGWDALKRRWAATGVRHRTP